MITPERAAVIRNIEAAVARGDLNCKVEIGDPVFTDEQRRETLERFLKNQTNPWYWVKNFIARRMADVFTWHLNRDTQIMGIEKIKDIEGGAIITSNHFNPVENTAIRRMTQKLRKGRLCIVNQDTNLGMTGLFGFFMNYIDIIPINHDLGWLKNNFDKLLTKSLKGKQLVLIYPEQEMWFNYRKPRPCKSGAYVFAARNKVPIISCFVEIREKEKLENRQFHQTQYILHVLDPIYPDPEKSVAENGREMCEKDYRQKVEAYELCYGKQLDYSFSPWDIAGWIPDVQQSDPSATERDIA